MTSAHEARGLNRRQALLWQFFDFSRGRGLEIGPLHSVAVPRAAAEVEYLDVFDRAQLVEHYAGDEAVPSHLIPDIDHVLFDGARVRSITETVGTDRLFDWVMASHVIEHVPDVVAWLDQIAQVTTDDGTLVLVVPDRRYSFDAHRPATSLGQLLQAYELGDSVPSVRAVFDHHRSAVRVRPQDAWAGRPVGYEARAHTREQALAQTARARTGDYVDCHVWLFTPDSLLEQLIELRTLGLSEWCVASLQPTARDQLEFYVTLRRLPRGGWDDTLLASEPQPATMPDWLADTAALTAELAATRAQLAAARSELAAQRVLADPPARPRLARRIRRRARTLPGWSLARRARATLSR